MSDGDFDDRLKEEIDFARALTALLLAARLEEAEHRAEQAYERIVGSDAAFMPRRRSA